MPRSISAALGTELAKVVTSIGYLVLINTAPNERWSNIGLVTWNGNNWLDRSFAITGLTFTPDEELSATLTLSNLDGVAGTLFNNPAVHIYDLVVTIYQFARGALAVGDVPQIASMSVDSCEITPEKVTLALRESNTDAKYAPRRRICPAEGFNFATQEGTVIQWNGEIYTVEPDNG